MIVTWARRRAESHVRATRQGANRAHRVSGTGSSNPFPSCGESANHRFLSPRRAGCRPLQSALRLGVIEDRETAWSSNSAIGSLDREEEKSG